MDFWIATTNSGKTKELERLIIIPELQIRTLKDLPSYSQPPETGKTFYENAKLKAKALKAVKNTDWVMAEDSGIEVTGLGNLPGVHSARYAGNNASDVENYLKVLKMLSLRSPLQREARFVCQIVLFTPDGAEHSFDGELKGQIGQKPLGKEGFGYDPIFVPDGETQTLAELGIAFKNKISHRSLAIKKMLSFLEGHL